MSNKPKAEAHTLLGNGRDGMKWNWVTVDVLVKETSAFTNPHILKTDLLLIFTRTT